MAIVKIAETIYNPLLEDFNSNKMQVYFVKNNNFNKNNLLSNKKKYGTINHQKYQKITKK